MKFTVLALGAAVAGITCVRPCSAQLNIESLSASQPESRLAFQRTEAASDVFAQASPTAALANGNDYFAPGSAGEGLGDPRSIVAEQSAKFTSAAQPPLPGTIPSAAPAPAPLGVLAHTPEVGMVPVYWPDAVGGCRTPNPIADIMMRNWCTDGLWATYPAERACQCVHIQQHTGGYNRYSNGGGACAHTCGCSPVVVGPAMASPPMAGPAMASSVDAGSAQRLAVAPQASPRPAAQLVISPNMSAPARLPTAQVAPSQQPAEVSVAPTRPAPAESLEPPVPQYQAAPSPLPANSLPTAVPVVASRSTGFLR